MNQIIKLFDRKIEKGGNRYFLILEAGTNHYEYADFMGITPVDAAKEMIKEASLAGAHAIKFQTFKAEKLASEKYAKNQYNYMRRRDFLDYDAYKDLAKFAVKSQGLNFITTVFDLDGLKVLGDTLKVFKVASPDITNYQLLDAINEYKKPVLLSTAGATIEEMRKALVRLVDCDVAILHCIAVYPTPPTRLNLGFIKKLNEVFNNNVIGWSSHNPDVSFAPMAFSFGANIFEYHFKMNVPIKGGDYGVSITKENVSELKTALHDYRSALGFRHKEFLDEEVSLRKNGRRSLFAAHNIQQGQRVDKSDFIALRPAIDNTYLDFEIDKVANKVAKNSISEHCAVYYDDLGIEID